MVYFTQFYQSIFQLDLETMRKNAILWSLLLLLTGLNLKPTKICSSVKFGLDFSFFIGDNRGPQWNT